MQEEVEVHNDFLVDPIFDLNPSQLAAEQLKHCPICYNIIKPGSEAASLWSREIMLAQCGHSFCESCFKANCVTVINRFNYNGRLEVKCPEYTCQRVLNEEEFKPYLSEDEIKKYQKVKIDIEVILDPKNRRFCPRPGCDTTIDMRKIKKDMKPIDCPTCQRPLCAKCGVEWHEGKTCS